MLVAEGWGVIERRSREGGSIVLAFRRVDDPGPLSQEHTDVSKAS